MGKCYYVSCFAGVTVAMFLAELNQLCKVSIQSWCQHGGYWHWQRYVAVLWKSSDYSMSWSVLQGEQWLMCCRPNLICSTNVLYVHVSTFGKCSHYWLDIHGRNYMLTIKIVCGTFLIHRKMQKCCVSVTFVCATVLPRMVVHACLPSGAAFCVRTLAEMPVACRTPSNCVGQYWFFM